MSTLGALNESIEAHLDELIVWKLQQQPKMTQKASPKGKWTHDLSDIESEEAESVVLLTSVPKCVPVKAKKSKTKSDTRSSGSDTGLSEGNKYQTLLRSHRSHPSYLRTLMRRQME